MDLIGMKFGRLTVNYRHPDDYITPSTGKHTPRYVCMCECGSECIVVGNQLKYGHTKSCGCLQRERSAEAHTTHGHRYERLHQIWSNMKNRCFNSNYAEFKDYGGRGVTVCDEWMQYDGFREWALKSGYNPEEKRSKQTLDRININGNYCPENCRFADMFVQANNKQNNIRYSYNGEERTLSEWSSFLNIPYNYLYYRIRTKGMDIADLV